MTCTRVAHTREGLSRVLWSEHEDRDWRRWREAAAEVLLRAWWFDSARSGDQSDRVPEYLAARVYLDPRAPRGAPPAYVEKKTWGRADVRAWCCAILASSYGEAANTDPLAARWRPVWSWWINAGSGDALENTYPLLRVIVAAVADVLRGRAPVMTMQRGRERMGPDDPACPIVAEVEAWALQARVRVCESEYRCGQLAENGGLRWCEVPPRLVLHAPPRDLPGERCSRGKMLVVHRMSARCAIAGEVERPLYDAAPSALAARPWCRVSPWCRTAPARRAPRLAPARWSDRCAGAP